MLSNLPWARDELAPEREALFVPLEAPAIADTVGRVLDDAALAERLGDEGRVRALAELDLAASSAPIDALYRSVLKGPQ